MHVLGRFLQVFGLILLPAGLIYGTSSGAANALGVELGALAVGGACFLLGRMMLGTKRP